MLLKRLCVNHSRFCFSARGTALLVPNDCHAFAALHLSRCSRGMECGDDDGNDDLGANSTSDPMLYVVLLSF